MSLPATMWRMTPYTGKPVPEEFPVVGESGCFWIEQYHPLRRTRKLHTYATWDACRDACVQNRINQAMTYMRMAQRCQADAEFLKGLDVYNASQANTIRAKRR